MHCRLTMRCSQSCIVACAKLCALIAKLEIAVWHRPGKEDIYIQKNRAHCTTICRLASLTNYFCSILCMYISKYYRTLHYPLPLPHGIHLTLWFIVQHLHILLYRIQPVVHHSTVLLHILQYIFYCTLHISKYYHTISSLCILHTNIP